MQMLVVPGPNVFTLSPQKKFFECILNRFKILILVVQMTNTVISATHLGLQLGFTDEEHTHAPTCDRRMCLDY